jgi:hypothetical protein
MALSNQSELPAFFTPQKVNLKIGPRVSFETSFDSKQPKLEPKQVSALSETKRLFRLFRFHNETAGFGVSVKPKYTEINRNKLKTMDRTRPSAA